MPSVSSQSKTEFRSASSAGKTLVECEIGPDCRRLASPEMKLRCRLAITCSNGPSRSVSLSISCPFLFPIRFVQIASEL